MADSAIILYLECIKGLISYFFKLGHCDLNKKNVYKNLYFKLLQINHQADLNEI